MASEAKQQWAKYLRDWQKECGLILKEAAEALGVPYGTYAAWVAAQQLPTESVGKAAMKRMDEVKELIQLRQRYKLEYSMVIKKVAAEIWRRA